MDGCALVFRTWDVVESAEETGEKKVVQLAGSGGKNKKMQHGNRNANAKPGRKLAKGELSKKSNDEKKQRGLENFQRYEF